MTPPQHLSLTELFERLMAVNSYVKVAVGEPTGAGWFSPADLLEGGALAEVLAQQAAHAPCQDKHYLAASFISYVSFQLVTATVGCYMSLNRLPDLQTDNLRFHFDENGNHDRLAFCRPTIYGLPDDPDAGHPDLIVLEDKDALQTLFRSQLEALFSPLVDALKAYSGMGKRGLWGIITDRIGGILIYAAQLLGRQDECEAEIEALLRITGSPLNTKTGVLRLEHQGHHEAFLERAACCLSYKVEAYGYCSTCPLVKAPERERRLREYMETRIN